MDNSVSSVQNQPFQQSSTPYSPNLGQRSPMPPATVQSLPDASPPVVQPVSWVVPAPVAIATPSSISFNREGGPVQTTVMNEDSDQAKLTQAFTPTIEDDSQKVVQQYMPTHESHQEDVQKTIQQYAPSAQEAGTVVQEGIMPSVPEVAISQELAHMMEAAKETESPFLPSELQAAGVKAAKEAVPVPPNPLGVQALPMSYQKSMQAIEENRKSKLSEGIRWFAELVAYQWRKVNPKVYQ